MALECPPTARAPTLRSAVSNGRRQRDIFEVVSDLVLDADREPAPQVLNAIRRHKAGIVALLLASGSDWSAEEWRAYFDERAGIVEFDGGQARADAEAFVFVCCLAEWFGCRPERSDPDRYVWCQKPNRGGHAIGPFGTEVHGHAWLHPECWNDWHTARKGEAVAALSMTGIRA